MTAYSHTRGIKTPHNAKEYIILATLENTLTQIKQYTISNLMHMQTTIIFLIIFPCNAIFKYSSINANFHNLKKQSDLGLKSLTQGYNAKPTSLQWFTINTHFTMKGTISSL